MRAPVISDRGIDSGQGVTMTPPAIRRCAARMSDRVTGMCSASCGRRSEATQKTKAMRLEKRGHQEARALHSNQRLGVKPLHLELKSLNLLRGGPGYLGLVSAF